MKQNFKTPLDLIEFLQIGGLLYNEKLSQYPFSIRCRDNNIYDIVIGDVLHFSHLAKVEDWEEYIISPKVCWLSDNVPYPNKKEYDSIGIVEFYLDEKEWNFKTLCNDGGFDVWKYATPLNDKELEVLGLKNI